MALKTGEWEAEALECEFGHSGTGTDQVAVSVRFVDGPNQGQITSWYGFFTDATTERTLESLMHMGWNGESLEKDKMKENGFGTKKFRVVLEEEEYQGKKRVKIQWINPSYGTAPMLKDKMEGGAQLAFASKMQGKLLEFKKKKAASKGPEKEPWEQDQSKDEPFGKG